MKLDELRMLLERSIETRFGEPRLCEALYVAVHCVNQLGLLLQCATSEELLHFEARSSCASSPASDGASASDSVSAVVGTQGHALEIPRVVHDTHCTALPALFVAVDRMPNRTKLHDTLSSAFECLSFARQLIVEVEEAGYLSGKLDVGLTVAVVGSLQGLVDTLPFLQFLSRMATCDTGVAPPQRLTYLCRRYVTEFDALVGTGSDAEQAAGHFLALLATSMRLLAALLSGRDEEGAANACV